MLVLVRLAPPPFWRTAYFERTRSRPDRASLSIEDVALVAVAPEHVVTQSDGRLRCWRRLISGRWLRVVLLEDGVTVHNAFLDRSFVP